MARAISGSAAGDAGAAFDQFFGRAAYLGQKAAKETSPMNWLPLLVSGAVFVIGALAAALGFGIAVLSKVALALWPLARHLSPAPSSRRPELRGLL